jgi:hypothetical protein
MMPELAAARSAPGAGSFKERFVALRTLRPFMVMVWNTSLTFFSLLLRLARALLPIAALCRQADHRRRR